MYINMYICRYTWGFLYLTCTPIVHECTDVLMCVSACTCTCIYVNLLFPGEEFLETNSMVAFSPVQLHCVCQRLILPIGKTGIHVDLSVLHVHVHLYVVCFI